MRLAANSGKFKIETKQLFAQTLVKLGLGALQPKFEANGWTTMANLAFGIGYSAKGPDDDAFKAEILAPLFGDQPNPLKPGVRRFYWEAFQMATNEMARRTNRNDEDEKPKKLPAAALYPAVGLQYDFENPILPLFP